MQAEKVFAVLILRRLPLASKKNNKTNKQTKKNDEVLSDTVATLSIFVRPQRLRQSRFFVPGAGTKVINL